MRRVECRLIELEKNISDLDRDIKINSIENAYELVTKEFTGLDRESCVVVTADGDWMALSISKVATGSLDSVSVSCRELFKVALLEDAKKILIVHNHTNGGVFPSKKDVDANDYVISIANALGIGIIDQLIISKDSVYSMNLQKKYKMVEKEIESF